jgi:hypothetical protein
MNGHSGQSDRRRFKRFEIKVFGTKNSFTIVLDKGVFLDCALLDICRGGIKVKIRTERKNLPAVEQGQKVEFRSILTPNYKILQGIKGKIAWVDMQEMVLGVSFNKPLPEDRFSEHE